MLPREKIDDVRERTNIVEIIKRHVELKRAGTASWKGLCPFHAEKTPSFHVHETRQFFNCFGCGEKGDVFSFLLKVEQRSFMEVLRDLAQLAGVDLPEKDMTPAERKAMAEAESERERMLRAMETATAFFEAQLLSPAGEAARAYLDKRGVSAETRARFRVGYAPAGWDSLQRHLAGMDVTPATAERLGLVGVNERGRYDFFRDRVMLPVLDRQKRPIGYSSRLLDPDAKDRKYVNSPDSPLFHKKENLYGLHAALEAIRKSGTAVVVEGNFDVMSLHDAGITEAVAPMGTALTAEQVAHLGRIAERVVVVFDGDEAGQRAARKAVPLFVDAGVDGRVARMPRGMDPDDFVRSEGADVFRRLMTGARPMVEQFIDDLSRETDPTIPGRVQSLDEAAAMVAKVRNPTERELYAGRLAVALGISPSQMMRAIRSAQQNAHRPTPAVTMPEGAKAPQPSRRTPPRAELEPLLVIVAHPAIAKSTDADRVLDLLVDQGLRQMYRTALEAMQRDERFDIPAWLDAGPPDIRDGVAAAVMEGRYDQHDGPERVLRDLVRTLERASMDAQIADLTRKQQEALARADRDAAGALAARIIELGKTKLGITQAKN